MSPNLEELNRLSGVVPDDPLRALPLEIFMREPRLLPRLLAREKLPPIRSLTELNGLQPRVVQQPALFDFARKRDVLIHSISP